MLVVEELFGDLDGEPESCIIRPHDFILGNAIEVLSSEETSSQGTPSNQPVVVFLKEGSIFNLNFISHQHVVLVRSSNRLMQV